ncbi:hypothetical protein HDU97_007706 [Phlyctochytrium planicorne]|nr:hypothetical protein HDU97_007706 [Phlyctochytrium planicorne]
MPKWRDLAAQYLKALAIQSVTEPDSKPQGPTPNSLISTASDVAPPFVPAGYTESFEVTAPIERPPGVNPCVVDLGWVAGRQFDRTIIVAIDGAEIFRGISHEPSRNGIWWKAESDVTSYAPLLKKSNLTVVAACDNIVNDVYTGIINVNIRLEYYPVAASASAEVSENFGLDNMGKSIAPDVLIPLSVSKESYSYVTLQGEGKAADFTVQGLPKNIAKAELEYHVSNHANDEFYYTNVPDSYANPSNGIFGHGPFKELRAFVDGNLAGVDYPSPAIYTGGFNPLLWRPFVSIGASKLPTFKMDFTPYAGVLSDGGAHTITLNVTNQTPGSLWFVEGILRLWLDAGGTQTTTVGPIQVDVGNKENPDVSISVNPANDANITTTLGERKVRIQSTVLLSSNQQAINTKVETRLLSFENNLKFTENTNDVVGSHSYKVVKTIEASVSDPVTHVLSTPLRQSYAQRDISLKFVLTYKEYNGGNDYIVNTTINQRWSERETYRIGTKRDNVQTLSIKNENDGDGYFGTQPGLASIHHYYKKKAVPEYPKVNSGCYLRDVYGFNRTVTTDRVELTC